MLSAERKAFFVGFDFVALSAGIGGGVAPNAVYGRGSEPKVHVLSCANGGYTLSSM
jgi:hypothetical protein